MNPDKNIFFALYISFDQSKVLPFVAVFIANNLEIAVLSWQICFCCLPDQFFHAESEFIVLFKVYVLNKSGLLTTYYKGEKQSEINTLVLADDSTVFATTKDSKYLYLINKSVGRIYLIAKDTGILTKTIKISSQEAFSEAYLDQDEAVYLLSKDNKIWKVQ